MRSLIMFLVLLLLLGLTGVAVYVSGIMYNVTEQVSVAPYIFQPGDLSRDRIGRPVLSDNLSPEYIPERLIKKFIYEYFYVIPDAEDLRMRERPNSTLANMTTPEIFKEWQEVILPELRKYSEQKQLQHVHVKTPIEMRGDYFEINYDLMYNDRSNDLSATPKIESGTIYIMIDYEPGIRTKLGGKDFDAGKFLDRGGDPATLFKFKVKKVAI